MENKTTTIEIDLIKLHIKLDMLLILLCDIAVVTGFPESHIDNLKEQWKKVTQ